MVAATQTWCLARYLPLLVGDLVPRDSEHWENYLQLLTIMDYVFAPTTEEGAITNLGVMIEDFLTDFVYLYDRRLTPKMHYLVHVPTWMLR